MSPVPLNHHWRRFPDGARFAGGRSYRMKIPLDEVAVFVPEGREIALGPDVEHTEALADGLQISSCWSINETSQQ